MRERTEEGRVGLRALWDRLSIEATREAATGRLEVTMSQREPDPTPRPIPSWLRALGGVALAAIGAALAYAVAIGVANFPRIGV